jgi:acyl dehydratase
MSTDDLTEVFSTNSDITQADIEEARALIGTELRVPEPFNTEATADAIRHYAYGIGDDNPLWCDPEYAARSRYGGIVAPPTFPYSVFPAGVGPGFGGLQAFQGGGRWELIRPIRVGEGIKPSARLLEVRDLQGRRSGRLIMEIGLAEYRTPEGELVATNMSRTFRKPRPGFDNAMRTTPAEPYQPSEEELEEIENRIISYVRRGDEPRYWDDTNVGESMEERVKGPLRLYDIIGFSIGIGNVAGGDIGVKNRHRAIAFPDQAPTTRPHAWWIERVWPGQGHMDPEVAKAVGIPTIYDVGWLRTAWMGQFVTDWIGDYAELKVLDIKLRLPNVRGDVLRLNGAVIRRYLDEEGRHLVDLTISAHRQDGEVSCDGSATVLLPARG